MVACNYIYILYYNLLLALLSKHKKYTLITASLLIHSTFEGTQTTMQSVFLGGYHTSSSSSVLTSMHHKPPKTMAITVER